MKTDEVDPMVELERLFNERKRFLIRRDDINNKIKCSKANLETAEQEFTSVQVDIINVEEQIKVYSKKL